ncbi:hypothetical protein GCM10010201_31890 [Pilimelia columellifera subsp. columellifera]|uniref:XRE family transcriptional regulator n=1 Tax=Pilimelia columellifera subsp. columellifera TaxID=706583 RepID=A0ABN3NPS4_9ACTN
MEPGLAAALRTGPFHVALREAIKARGLPLQRLQHRLNESGVHVGLGTLSYWQSGQRRPERSESLRAVTALEQILGLPPQSLLVLLGPRRPRGQGAGLPRGAKRYADIFQTPDALVSLLSSLGAHDGRLHLLSSHDVVTVADDGGVGSVESTHVVEAHQPTDRYVAIYWGDPGCDTELMSISAMDGCRVGRLRRDQESGLIIAELVFDFLLQVGQSHIIRYCVNDARPAPAKEYFRSVRFPAQHMVVQIRFPATRLPVLVWRFERPQEGGPDRFREEMPIGPHRSVHIAASRVEPGLVGVAWDWGDQSGRAHE